MQILQSKILHLGISMLLAFIPLIVFIDTDVLYLYTGCVLIMTTLVFIHAYWPAMRIAISTSARDIDKADMLTLALFIVYTTNGLREAYAIFVREILPLLPEHGRSDTYFIFPTVLQYAALVGGLLAVSARNEHHKPSILNRLPGWPRGVFAVTTGIALGFVFHMARP